MLAIPVLIHLFNLRKYKTVMFPHTRFLRNIQLHSRKQSQVRYKLLLASRLLFLLLLILAFAQPFFKQNHNAATDSALKVIYIDNSYSMSARKGARTLLDIAVQSATAQVGRTTPGSRFLILTNDNPESYYPVSANKALAILSHITFSASSRTATQVLSLLHSLGQEQSGSISLFYYSDFQQHAFPYIPDEAALKKIQFYAMPLRAEQVSDVAIDTAFLMSPVLIAGKSNWYAPMPQETR